MEVAGGKLTKVDTDYLYELGRDFAWAPDSKWIAFTKALPNRLRAIFIYSLESGKSTQITDGMSDARSPVFDRDGQYLYFTRQHELRADHQRPRHDERRARSDEQHLPRRAAEQYPVAAGARERRGEAAASRARPMPAAAAADAAATAAGRGRSAEAGAHRLRQDPAAHRRAADPGAPVSRAGRGTRGHALHYGSRRGRRRPGRLRRRARFRATT